jgi:hypothetical protein
LKPLRRRPRCDPCKEAPAVSVAGVESRGTAAAGAVAKLEERFRSDIDSRLRGAEIAITGLENTAAKVEASLKDGSGRGSKECNGPEKGGR